MFNSLVNHTEIIEIDIKNVIILYVFNFGNSLELFYYI